MHSPKPPCLKHQFASLGHTFPLAPRRAELRSTPQVAHSRARARTRGALPRGGSRTRSGPGGGASHHLATSATVQR